MMKWILYDYLSNQCYWPNKYVNKNLNLHCKKKSLTFTVKKNGNCGCQNFNGKNMVATV